MPEQEVRFLVAANAKGGGINLRSVEIPVDKLKANLASATAGLSLVLEHIVEVGRFELQEVQIGVEVGAEGGVEFIGTVTASGKASITLTFKPRSVTT
jgi:hypothetical protein